jgi:hypothetical protein
MSRTTAPTQFTYASFDGHLPDLLRLDAQFDRLAGTIESVADAGASLGGVIWFDAPGGGQVRLDVDRRWPTVWIFDTRPDRDVPPLMAEVGFCRLWRPPCDLLAEEDRRWLADRSFAGPHAPVLPERWEPEEGWRDPGVGLLRSLTAALRWAHFRLVVATRPAA